MMAEESKDREVKVMQNPNSQSQTKCPNCGSENVGLIPHSKSEEVDPEIVHRDFNQDFAEFQCQNCGHTFLGDI